MCVVVVYVVYVGGVWLTSVWFTNAASLIAVLGIFGLIVAIILGGGITGPDENGMATYSQFNGWSDLAAGVCCGATCLAAGYATGIGEKGVMLSGEGETN